MIDLNKNYRTKSGKKVVGLKFIPQNSAGANVTYPIKGSVVEKEAPLRLRYQIWSEDGVADVVWGRYELDNLVEENVYECEP